MFCISAQNIYKYLAVMIKAEEHVVLPLLSLLPGHLNFSAIVCTISQIEIDKNLIRDSICCRHRLKIIQRAPFNINSNLYLARVRIFTWIQFSDIILVPHS